MGLLTKDTDYLSIVFSDEAIKMCHLKMTSLAKEVVHIVQRDIKGISEEELPKIVKSALNDFNVRKPKVICVIPPQLMTTKNIEIPSLNPEEIKSIINLQAGRHTPYSREEIIIDYLTIGVYQRNYTKVLLVIVNRNIIKKQLAILEQAGLKVAKVQFSSEGIARFYTKALDLTSQEAPVGFIDIAGSSTDFTVGLRGNVITCRSIPIGMTQLLNDGQSAAEKLVQELKKSIESYQSEDIERVPDSYILTSDHQKVKELLPALKGVFNVNVKIVPYLDIVKISPAARKSLSDLSNESFLDLVAPATVSEESKIDLLPEEIRMQFSLEAQAKQVAMSGIFATIIFILIAAFFVTKIYFKNTYLSKLRTNYSAIMKESDALEKISAKTRIVKDYFNNRLVSLETINELYNIVPEEIYLTSINLDENGTIAIQGTSESMSRVFSLVTALEESKLFKSVKTNSTTAKKERGKDVAAFEVVFKLESAKDFVEEADETGEKIQKEKPPLATAAKEEE